MYITPASLHSRATGHNVFNQISYQSDCFYLFTLHIYIMRLTDQIRKETFKKKNLPKTWLLLLFMSCHNHTHCERLQKYSHEKYKRYIFFKMYITGI